MRKAFTLIELLVVIAIIGLLSAVVLASLNTARGKGADAAIKSNLNNTRAQAALYFDGAGNGTYGTAILMPAACPTAGATMFYADVNIRNAIASAKVASGNAFNACVTNATPTSNWAIVQQYKSNPAKGWCVDGAGDSKEITIASPYGQADVSVEIGGTGCAE